MDNGNKDNKLSNWLVIRQSIKRFLKPKIIRSLTAEWRAVGFWQLLKRKGWKVIILIILFYLIRDTFLYIILPYLAVRGALGN